MSYMEKTFFQFQRHSYWQTRAYNHCLMMSQVQCLLTTSDPDMSEVYIELVAKIVHTRLNDLLKGTEQLQSWEDNRGVNPELSLMLRDKLKGIVASH